MSQKAIGIGWMMRKAANLLTPQHIIEQKGDNFNLVRLPSSRLDVLLGVFLSQMIGLFDNQF